jgi:phosphoribosylamine---glycine ligase
MNVLIIGGGGREHALAWKCAQSTLVDVVFCAPGNPGTGYEKKVRNIPIASDQTDSLVRFALAEKIDLTIVGPEAPLVAGVVDAFEHAGLLCFGPSKQAAILEASKSYTKDFLKRHEIPSGEYQVFVDIDSAVEHINKVSIPVVVKADGLAAGKGVVVATTRQQALDAAYDMLEGNAFGDAGAKIVVEEFLIGEEASFICMTDGITAIPFASSQDHKARDEGDKGPNTGGMGAYSPAPIIDEEMEQEIINTVILPTLKGMQLDGRPYKGFLYAGLMIGIDKIPKVLEFNCRFGDPETQPIMCRLVSDLVGSCMQVLSGEADKVKLEWDPRAALGVVMAAEGYPFDYSKGDIITGLEEDTADTKVFHAGTSLSEGLFVTSGGRVLCIVGLGASVEAAQTKAYARASSIDWTGKNYRKDIGYRAVLREQSKS